MTSPRALLATIEPLSAVDRARHISSLARALAVTDGAALDGLITGLLDLAAGSRHYETDIALRLAQAGRRTRALLRLITSPYPDVAGRAATALAAGAVDTPAAAEMVAMVPDLPADTLGAVTRGLLRAPTTDLADAFLPALRGTRDDRLAGAVLAVCSPAVVAAHIDDLWPVLTHRRLLARRHPEAALAAIRRHLAQPGAGRYWLGASATIDGLLSADPDRYAQAVLDLVETHHPRAPHGGFGSRQSVGILAARAPHRTATIVVRLLTDQSASGDGPRILSRRTLRRFLAVTDLPTATPGTPAETPALAARAGTQPLVDIARAAPAALVRILAVVPPRDRGAFWDAVHQGRDTDNLPIDVEQLELLPRERRHAEARRLLVRAAEHTDPHARAIALSLLPLAEAENDLRTATTHADPLLRATAYRHLIACAHRTREPGEVLRVLASLTRLRNEREPVRLQVLNAIGAIPVGLLTHETAPVLDAIFRDAVEARDHSPLSARAIRTLCAKILVGGQDGPPPQHSPLATTALAGLYRNTGSFWLPDLSTTRTPTREAVVQLFLLPLIEEEADKKSFVVLSTLLLALGNRAHEHTSLVGLVGRLFQRKSFAGRGGELVIDMAIDLVLHEPTTRDEWLRRITDTYPGAIHHHRIWALASTRHTDLLTHKALTTKKTRYPARQVGTWVPHDLRGARRWTPAQVHALTSHLDAVIATKARNNWAAHHAITALAALPDVGYGRLVALAHHKDVLSAERALQALSTCDRPAIAHTELLTHLRGDRARVAAYAVVRTARRLPPRAVVAAWTRALSRTLEGEAPVKITARKALILAVPPVHLPVPTSRTLLGDDPHRDVRTAAASAALRCTADPAAWPILDELLAASPLAGHLIGSIAPPTLRPADRHRFAALVARLCATTGTRDDQVASRTAAVRASGPWAPHHPAIGQTLYDHITNLDDDQTWRTARDVALSLVRDGWTTGWSDAVAGLLDLDHADPPPLDPDRTITRRAHQRLTALTTTGDRWRRPQDAPGHVADVVRLLADARTPAGTPSHLGLACSLLADALPLADTPEKDPDDTHAVLARLCTLVGRRTALAMRVGEALTTRLLGRTNVFGVRVGATPRTRLDDLEIAVARLLPSASGVGQAVLLGVVEGSGALVGWTPPWRAHLEVLRASTDADVSEAARGVAQGAP